MTHAPVQPKDAASVMLIRSGSRGLEILFLRRNPSLAFQGDHWVFPGGRIDPIDKDVDRPHDELPAAQKAAVREAAEESGVLCASPLSCLRNSLDNPRNKSNPFLDLVFHRSRHHPKTSSLTAMKYTNFCGYNRLTPLHDIARGPSSSPHQPLPSSPA